MKYIDITQDTRIPVYLEMVSRLGRAEDPAHVLDVWLAGLQRVYAPRGYMRVSTRDLPPGSYRVLWLRGAGGKEIVPHLKPMDNPALLPVHTGGFIAQLIASSEPKLVHELDVAGDPAFGDTFAMFHSALAVPLFGHRMEEDWSLLFDPDPRGFGLNDLVEAILRSNLLSSTVENLTTLQTLREANAWIESEIDQIASIQRSLLPPDLPDIPGIEVAASYETFDRAGGDYYDFVRLRKTPDGKPDPNGPWGIVIADAAGHGPSAAVVVAMLHAILHSYPGEPAGPVAVLDHINRHLKTRRVRHAFVTAFFGLYDPATRELRYARAGHEIPLHVKSGETLTVHRLDESAGFPLGIFDDLDLQEGRVTLQASDTLLLYTDGVTETTSDEGIPLGVEGLERALHLCDGHPACAVETIRAAVRAHENGRRPSDDQTIVIVRARSEARVDPPSGKTRVPPKAAPVFPLPRHRL